MSRIHGAESSGNTLASGGRHVLLMGDLNSYGMEDPIRTLTNPLFDPPEPANQGHPGFAPNPEATYSSLTMKFLGAESNSF